MSSGTKVWIVLYQTRAIIATNFHVLHKPETGERRVTDGKASLYVRDFKEIRVLVRDILQYKTSVDFGTELDLAKIIDRNIMGPTKVTFDHRARPINNRNIFEIPCHFS